MPEGQKEAEGGEEAVVDFHSVNGCVQYMWVGLIDNGMVHA